MNQATFEHEMAKAKTFSELGERSDFYRGYMRGLRRRYHGENFGEPGEHEKWLDLINDDYREEMGRGYRAGFYYRDYCTQNENDCLTCSLVNYGRDCENNPIDG